MKYIIFEDFSGDPVPFIFPNRVDHAEFREQMPYATILSAGYVQVREGSFSCHGEARGMAASRPEDAGIIASKLENPDR